MKKKLEPQMSDLLEAVVLDTVGKFVPTFEAFRQVYLPTELQKRTSKWIETIEEKISHLDDLLKGFSSEEGVSLFLKASAEAMKTHKQEKLLMLGEVLCGVIRCSENYDRKNLLLSIATELEPLDILVLKNIDEKQKDFFNIRVLNPIYDFLVAIGYPGSKDEFLYSINKLEAKSLLRRRKPGLELTGDVPNPDGFGSPDDGKLPAIKVTDLGKQLQSFISFNFQIKQ